MPFIIPLITIGAGGSLIVWGTRLIWTKDDSADERARKLLARFPKYVQKYVESFEIKGRQIKIILKDNTPGEIQREIMENVVEAQEELEARIGRNSQNSNRLPSSDTPHQREKRMKSKDKKKPGAKKGHQGH